MINITFIARFENNFYSPIDKILYKYKDSIYFVKHFKFISERRIFD